MRRAPHSPAQHFRGRDTLPGTPRPVCIGCAPVRTCRARPAQPRACPPRPSAGPPRRGGRSARPRRRSITARAGLERRSVHRGPLPRGPGGTARATPTSGRRRGVLGPRREVAGPAALVLAGGRDRGRRGSRGQRTPHSPAQHLVGTAVASWGRVDICTRWGPLRTCEAAGIEAVEAAGAAPSAKRAGLGGHEGKEEHGPKAPGAIAATLVSLKAARRVLMAGAKQRKRHPNDRAAVDVGVGGRELALLRDGGDLPKSPINKGFRTSCPPARAGGFSWCPRGRPRRRTGP